MRITRTAVHVRFGLALMLLAAACERNPDDLREPPPPADPAREARVPFTRIGRGALRIGERGVMVVRTPEAWQALWTRYSSGEAPPRVDFTQEMVAAVSLGGGSSCTDWATYVWRVEQAPDTLFIVIGHDGYPSPEPVETCDMYVEPVDLVRIPRSELPVRFVGYAASFPVPDSARWLAPDSTR